MWCTSRANFHSFTTAIKLGLTIRRLLPVALHTLVIVQGSRLQVVGNICVVTEGTTLLVITQVSSGLILIFSSYLHVKVASLATVKSCVNLANVWPCIALVD